MEWKGLHSIASPWCASNSSNQAIITRLVIFQADDHWIKSSCVKHTSTHAHFYSWNKSANPKVWISSSRVEWYSFISDSTLFIHDDRLGPMPVTALMIERFVGLPGVNKMEEVSKISNSMAITEIVEENFGYKCSLHPIIMYSENLLHLFRPASDG